MTLDELRAWHRAQMMAAADARDWCQRGITQGKRGVFADQVSVEAIHRFHAMVLMHHDAMMALDRIRDMLDSSSRP